ncbi:unnamed protein product [Symbiodinium sp. CCMP2456]|nr:unnamed protein product [Symbiodinium sp. CCMP2456]
MQRTAPRNKTKTPAAGDSPAILHRHLLSEEGFREGLERVFCSLSGRGSGASTQARGTGRGVFQDAERDLLWHTGFGQLQDIRTPQKPSWLEVLLMGIAKPLHPSPAAVPLKIRRCPRRQVLA